MKTSRNIFYTSALGLCLVFGATSCVNDLDTVPLAKTEAVAENVFTDDLGNYTSAVAKIYAGWSITGNKGGDNEVDIAGVDGGSQATFLRGLWNLQELPSDEAHCNWTDVGVNDLNTHIWSSGNAFIKGFYYRLLYQAQMANAFLRQTTDELLASRGVSDADKTTIKGYRAEARFNRALAYFYLLDMFRNVPFATESTAIGSFPEQILAADLFKYIETELTTIENEMPQSFVGYDSQNYGKATQAAVWSLLSRLYLNAEIYIGTPKYTESVIYSKKVIAVGYVLDPVYANLFKADNHKSTEMIFPIRYEGDQTMTWGGMTFLLCSTVPSALQKDINAAGAWQGNRARSSLLKLFENESNSDNDLRKEMIRVDLTKNIEIVTPSEYVDNGIPVVKYNNVNSDGSLPPSNQAWIDFPLFRLGEIYLNYAEAVLRGAKEGDKATALGYINLLRERSGADAISEKDLTLPFILDERGREFFFEAQRRTDLVRFGLLTSSDYIWPWKGGVASGRGVDKHYNIFPLPSDEIGSNTNLKQNEGYN